MVYIKAMMAITNDSIRRVTIEASRVLCEELSFPGSVVEQ